MATLVNTGKVISAKRIAGIDSVPAVTYMALGTDNTAEAAEDTALGAETSAEGLERAVATVVYEADYKTKWSHTFTNTSNIAVEVNEIGLCNAASASGSDLYMRHVFSSTVNILDSGSAEFIIREMHSQA